MHKQVLVSQLCFALTQSINERQHGWDAMRSVHARNCFHGILDLKADGGYVQRPTAAPRWTSMALVAVAKEVLATPMTGICASRAS